MVKDEFGVVRYRRELANKRQTENLDDDPFCSPIEGEEQILEIDEDIRTPTMVNQIANRPDEQANKTQ